MTAPLDPSPLSTCEHPDCGATDNHPKFHLIDWVVQQDGTRALDWAGTWHHDCAAALAVHPKAQVIVDATGGAKGDLLRFAMTDPTHPVHEAVRAHSEMEAAQSHMRNVADAAALSGAQA